MEIPNCCNLYGSECGEFPKKLNINPHMILLYPYLAYAQYSVSHVHCCSSDTSQKRAQPTCPSTDKWILKMGYIYTEYYSAVKKNELINFVGKWWELDKITFNKLAQMQKDKGHMFFSHWRILALNPQMGIHNLE